MKKLKITPIIVSGMSFIIGLSLPIVASAAAPDYMNVLTVGNTADASIALEDINKITFSEETLDVIKNDETTFSTLYANFHKITFSAEPAGLEDIDEGIILAQEISIKYSQDKCFIESAQKIEIVSLFNLQGRLMRQIAPLTENTELFMGDYPKGIYIVKACNGETVKTQKIIKH